MTNYDKICKASQKLTAEEQLKVLQYIDNLHSGNVKSSSAEESAAENKSEIEPESQEQRICPHCLGENVIKFGQNRGKQRYYCKDCNKLFVGTTGTIMENSHYSIDVWKEVIADTIDGFISIDKTANRLGLSHNTVFNMRHKILMTMEREEKLTPVVLREISELDETYVLESFKGTKLPENGARKPRKHGSKSQLRGISNEQICIMTGVQRNKGNAYATTVNRAHPSKDEIEKAFRNHIDAGCVAFTDGLKGYKHLETVIDCVVESVSIDAQKNSKTANLNNVNSFHSFIQERYDHYRGLATRYLNRYNALFARTFRAKDRLAQMVSSVLCNRGVGTFSYWDVKNVALVTV